MNSVIIKNIINFVGGKTLNAREKEVLNMRLVCKLFNSVILSHSYIRITRFDEIPKKRLPPVSILVINRELTDEEVRILIEKNHHILSAIEAFETNFNLLTRLNGLTFKRISIIRIHGFKFNDESCYDIVNSLNCDSVSIISSVNNNQVVLSTVKINGLVRINAVFNKIDDIKFIPNTVKFISATIIPLTQSTTSTMSTLSTTQSILSTTQSTPSIQLTQSTRKLDLTNYSYLQSLILSTIDGLDRIDELILPKSLTYLRVISKYRHNYRRNYLYKISSNTSIKLRKLELIGVDCEIENRILDKVRHLSIQTQIKKGSTISTLFDVIRRCHNLKSLKITIIMRSKNPVVIDIGKKKSLECIHVTMIGYKVTPTILCDCPKLRVVITDRNHGINIINSKQK